MFLIKSSVRDYADFILRGLPLRGRVPSTFVALILFVGIILK